MSMLDSVVSVGNRRIRRGEASVERISSPADNLPDARKLASVGRKLPRQPSLASVGRRPPRQPSLASVGWRPPRQPPLASVGRRHLRNPTVPWIYKDLEFPYMSLICVCIYENHECGFSFKIEISLVITIEKSIFKRNHEMISRSLRSCW